MKKSLVSGLAAAVVLAIAGIAWATDDDEDDINAARLAKALAEASGSLDQGLKASESEGKPISGKFESQNGALQLSVYTMKQDQFSEVAVDHKSGSIKKSEPITDPDDLKRRRNGAEPWQRRTCRSPRRAARRTTELVRWAPCPCSMAGNLWPPSLDQRSKVKGN